MLQRMMGAAFFNVHTYEDIERDENAMGQAISVVLLVTVCGIIGGLLGDFLSGEVSIFGILTGVVGGLFFGIVRWALWVTVLLLVGGNLLRTSGTRTSWSEMGRVLGFAYTPGILSILSWVPFIGGLFSIIGFVWTLTAATIGIRQALDFQNTRRAVLVVLVSGVIGFIPWIIIWAVQEWLL